MPLQWRHNEHDGVLNHRRLHLFAELLVQVQIKEHIKAPRHLPLCGEFTGDRRWPVSSPYKRPVTRKIFPFNDFLLACVDIAVPETLVCFLFSLKQQQSIIFVTSILS